MNTKQDNIIRTDYAEIMQKSYIDYAMSVIISRALPDVRDGLKPVQRRTLYDMYELGIRYDRPYRKCARIVGDTMGKYHPHGDSSIYDALVVMAQEFKKGRTLVDGHGNFGSIEGDGAAAMRYTEARLSKISMPSPPYIPKSEMIPRSAIMKHKMTRTTRRDSRITMVGSTMETACEIRSMDLSVYCRESLRKVSSLEPE